MTPREKYALRVLLGMIATGTLLGWALRDIAHNDIPQADPDLAPVVFEEVTTTTTAPTTTVAPTTAEPTTVAPTTTIEEGWLCPKAIHIARMVGWPDVELPTLDAIVWRESRCNGRAHNQDDPASGSRGLLQINGYWCATTDFLQQAGVLWDCADLFDDVTSMKAGLVIWQRSGWSPWGG